MNTRRPYRPYCSKQRRLASACIWFCIACGALWFTLRIVYQTGREIGVIP